MLKQTILFAAVAGLVLALAPAAQGGPGPLVPGALGYWSFEDHTANDHSGNGNDCSWVGPPAYVNYVNPGDTPHPASQVAMDLTARNSAIGGANYVDENVFDTPSHSVAFWTKGPPTGDWGNWNSKTQETDGWMIRQHTSNRYNMHYNLRGVGGDLSIAINHDDNVWRHYVMTKDDASGQTKIYENGNPTPVASGSGGSLLNSLRTLVWGDRDSSDDPGYQASGGGNYIGTMMDELYFFNRAITPDEVELLFNIPEPATMALLLLIGAPLLALRRRRR